MQLHNLDSQDMGKVLQFGQVGFRSQRDQEFRRAQENSVIKLLSTSLSYVVSHFSFCELPWKSKHHLQTCFYR